MTSLQQQFTNLETALSAHWGLESTNRVADIPSEIATGTEDIMKFNPGLKFSWKYTFDIALKLKVRSVFLTAVHHGGFPLWPSTVTADHCVSATEWGQQTGRDPFGEFCEFADRLIGDKGVYFSVCDNWLYLQCGSTFNSTFINTKKAQLTEILGGAYGKFRYIFHDGWGDAPWGDGGSPSFADIALDEILDHVYALDPDILQIVNSHNDAYGDIRLYEDSFEGRPKRPLLTKPTALHHRIGQKWFNAIDRPLDSDPLTVADIAVSAQDQMAVQNCMVMHNLSPKLDGQFDADQLAIVDRMATQTIPRLWRGTTLHWDFDQALVTDNATESLQGYVLTQVNSPGIISDPLLGSGRSLNGTNQYFTRVAHQTSYLSIGPDSFTLAFRGVGHTFSTDTPFPRFFSKDDATESLIEWELYTNGGVPTFRISRDGTNRQDLASSIGALTADEPFSGFVAYDFINKQMIVFISTDDGHAIDYADCTYPDLEDGVAESVSPFVFGALGNGSNLWSGRIYTSTFVRGRVWTEADGIEYHNGGKRLTLFEAIPARDTNTLIRRIKVRNPDGTPATGLAAADFTAKYNVTGSRYHSLQLEDAGDFPGVYTEPSTAGHVCLIEVDSTDDPVKGIYEVHFHNAQFGSNDILWLYMASDGKLIDPLEVHINTNVTHISGIRQVGADIGSQAFHAATQATAANTKIGTPAVDLSTDLAVKPSAAQNAAALLATENGDDVVGVQLARVDIASSEIEGGGGGVRPQKNTALPNFKFKLEKSNGDPATGKTVTAQRSIDNGSFATCANAVSEKSDGWYTIDLTAADLNGDSIALKFTAPGARQRDILVIAQA